MRMLLAVDLGLRTGLAAYGADGRLRWYRSTNFGSRARLRRGAYAVVRDVAAAHDLAAVVMEGGGAEATAWRQAAARCGVPVTQIGAERWRRKLLPPRDRRSGTAAKAAADALARRVIAWSGADAPTALRHDAAEAVCIGLWAALAAGWLDDVPEEVKR